MQFDPRQIWDGPGLLIRYEQGFLTVADLNPEVLVKHRMSRLEVLRTGLWFIRRAIFG